MITQKNPVGRYAVEIKLTATAAESPIHNPPSKISASFTSCSPLPFRSPVSGFSFFFTPLPANPVLLSKIHPKSKFLLPSHFCLPPSNKCAQIAKEWLDKGLAKCHEIAVLYPSSRNPPAWIGKIHSISFVDTSGRAEESSRVQTREPSATAAKPPSPLRYGWLPAYTFDFPAAHALSRGCSSFYLHTSSFSSSAANPTSKI